MFNAQYGSQEALVSSVSRPFAPLPANAIRELHAVGIKTNSKIRNHMANTPEWVRDVMQATGARFGLNSFKPDLLGDPYSPYNVAHRLVSILSFRSAMTGFAYSFLAPSAAYIHNTLLLFRIYDHFVFFHLRRLQRMEFKKPGSVQNAASRDAAYKNRKRVSWPHCICKPHIILTQPP
jgi:hypothetical protein